MGLFLVVQALWLFLPAYVANMAPVFAMKVFPRWNSPLDGGLVLADGRRLLGEGKTVRGLVSGILFGAGFAAGQSAVRYTSFDLSDFGHGETGGVWGPLTIGAAMGFGAILGDAAKSYFKRRTGRRGGAPWVPFDQLDFVLGGLLFGWFAAWLLKASGAATTNWWMDEFGGSRWPALALLVLLTPGLHFLVNWIGYRLHLKKVPW